MAASRQRGMGAERRGRGGRGGGKGRSIPVAAAPSAHLVSQRGRSVVLACPCSTCCLHRDTAVITPPVSGPRDEVEVGAAGFQSPLATEK